MPRLIASALFATLVLVLAACGGSDDPPTNAEYTRAVASTVDRTDFALGRVTRSKSKDELVERMAEASAAIAAAASDLDEHGAPEVFVEENEKLVSSLETLANDIGLTGEQIDQPGSEDLLDGARGLSFDSWDEANLALASLIGSGLPVQTLQRH
jgi:hypothetical protein